MKILNYTPHVINICNEMGQVTASYNSVGNARVTTRQEEVGKVNEIAVYATEYGEVEGLPDKQDDTFIIVSFMVKQAMQGRQDLICPNTSPNGVVRNESGQIIGVKSFQI